MNFQHDIKEFEALEKSYNDDFNAQQRTIDASNEHLLTPKRKRRKNPPCNPINSFHAKLRCLNAIDGGNCPNCKAFVEAGIV